jgi:NTE family protein
MPVYGVPARSYADGGIAVRPGATSSHGVASAGDKRLSRGNPASGLPRLSWPGRNIETAFVLGGGGNRGAVQVGMLRALTERRIVPDLVVGTSIGSINAAGYASEPSLEGVELAAEIWRRIAADQVFPRSRFHGSWRFLDRREGVFSMDGLRQVVGGFLRFERLEEAALPIVLVATRLEDGAEEWFTEGPAIDAVMASAALPGFYPVVELGGAHYFDGGVLDNVALPVALAAGAKRIFVLLCGTVETPAPTFSRPYEAMFAAFTMALHARFRRELARVPPDVDVVVFEQPGAVTFDPLDFSKTDQLIEQGYKVARDVIDSYLVVSGAEQAARLRRPLFRHRGQAGHTS